MKRSVLFLLVTLAMASTSLATESGSLFWEFQNTGFQAGIQPYISTAVALRDGTWPVVAYLDNSYLSMDVVSLYPVPNYSVPANNYPSYWHQIGNNLAYVDYYNSNGSRITSSYSEDEFNFSIRNLVTSSSYPAGVTVTGTSTGWMAPEDGVIDTDYDTEGNLARLTSSTVSVSQMPPYGWTAISASTPGNVGVLQEDNGYLLYHQANPYLDGWFSDLSFTMDYVFQNSSDIALGSDGVPHIAYTNQYGWLEIADFDVISGSWKKTILDSDSSSAPPIATLADSEDGTIGAAWICDGDLKYAYKEGSNPWVISTVVNDCWVSSSTPQIPGLAFDAEGLPIISYVDPNGYVNIAYDPIMAPEPSTILLLLSGVVSFVVLVSRKNRNA